MGADAKVAMAVVGDEVARAIREDRNGTWGISQALILAFLDRAAATDGPDHVDTAFACFDAALAVIEARTPRIHPYDDPDQPYTPPSPDNGDRTPGDVGAACATAAIAGLTRPGREAKRRALLATEHLLTEQPSVAADGVMYALANLSDPATLTWLLALLVKSVTPDSPALASSNNALTKLAGSPHLSVRVLARSLLVPPPALGPQEPADPELLGITSTQLWIPGQDLESKESASVRALVDEIAGDRLAETEPLLPGLTAAVERRTASALEDEAVERKMRRQMDALRDRHGRKHHWPDAWLAYFEAAEDALQRAAAGARAVDLRRGVIRDPVAREAALAERLIDSPDLALALEGTRLPRPAVPPPPSRHDPSWTTTAAAAGTTPGASRSPSKTMATTGVVDFDQLDDAGGGWRVLASVEALFSAASHQEGERDVIAFRFRCTQASADVETADVDLPIFAEGDLADWVLVPPVQVAFRPPQQLASLTRRSDWSRNDSDGLGLPRLAVAPTAALLIALQPTTPSAPFEVRDGGGALAALRTWRALYESSDYHQPWPRLTGAALVVTRRGFDRLANVAPGLVMRDFILQREATEYD